MRSVLASLLLGALLFSSFPATARADDAASLLAKHKAYVGWQFGDGSVNTLELTRTYTDAAGKVTQRASELRAGLAYRRDYDSSKDYQADPSTGFTGRLFWTTSGNGFTIPLIGDTAKYYLAIDALFMEGTPELPAELHGTGTVGGKTVPVVRVTMNGALPIDLYVDPDTGAYLQAVIDPGGAYDSTMLIRSYTDLGGGKKMIGSWSLGDDKGVYSYEKPQLNANIGASDLHPPASSATWTFANAEPFPIRATQTRLYVDAIIDGTPGRFIIDTGSSDIALTDDFANRAHIKTVDRAGGFGIGGTTKSLVRKVNSVVIGGNTLNDVVISSFNVHFNDTNNFEHPDGLIGFDLFAGAIVNLNVSSNTMQIQDPSTAAADGRGGYPITPDLTGGVPVVGAKLDNRLDIRAILDTGGSTLVLISSQVEDHGVNLIVNQDRTFLGGNELISGVAGSEMVRCGPLGSVAVGPLVYAQTQACESHNWPLHSGLIGFDFLKHFDYVFDYPHGVMYMIPHKQ